jgi:hypothetical protein
MEITNLFEGVFAESTGWTWTVEREDGSTLDYRTNKNYEGLFYWNKITNAWSQEVGTGQFSLSKNRGTALRQLRSRFAAN